MKSISQYPEKNREKLATTTNRGFLETYNPKSLAVAFRDVKNPLAAIDSGGSNLFALRKTYGDTKVAALIKLYMLELNNLLNLKRSLSEEMIDAIADELIASYSMLNIADVHLVFRRAKTGHYGELFENINMPKVLKWFADYFEERCSAAAQRSIEQGESYKKDTPRTSEAAEELEKQFRIKYMKFVNNK